MSFLKRA